MKSKLLLFGSLTLLFTTCKLDKPALPEEEIRYIFKFQTEVDAMKLDCGYYENEKCSDDLKRQAREAIGDFSIADQKRMGQEFHQDLMGAVSNDEVAHERVQSIVDKMKPLLKNQELDYDVYILDQTRISAFTTPGGNIYFTTGILNLIESDDQLAYIVGHELGHNENHHTKESGRMYKYLKSRQSEGFFGTISAIWTGFRAQNCNQSDEIECDITGIYLAHAVGYDPELALGAMQILQRMDNPRPGNSLEEWWESLFRSHPWSSDRLNCMRNYVANAKTEVKCTKVYDDKNAKVTTKKDPLNIRKYPNVNAEEVGEAARNSEVTAICDCAKQKNGRTFMYIETKDGVKGWADKTYLKVQ